MELYNSLNNGGGNNNPADFVLNKGKIFTISQISSKSKRLLSVFLALALVLTFLLVMASPAMAAAGPNEIIVNGVTLVKQGAGANCLLTDDDPDVMVAISFPYGVASIEGTGSDVILHLNDYHGGPIEIGSGFSSVTIKLHSNCGITASGSGEQIGIKSSSPTIITAIGSSSRLIINAESTNDGAYGIWLSRTSRIEGYTQVDITVTSSSTDEIASDMPAAAGIVLDNFGTSVLSVLEDSFLLVTSRSSSPSPQAAVGIYSTGLCSVTINTDEVVRLDCQGSNGLPLTYKTDITLTKARYLRLFWSDDDSSPIQSTISFSPSDFKVKTTYVPENNPPYYYRDYTYQPSAGDIEPISMNVLEHSNTIQTPVAGVTQYVFSIAETEQYTVEGTWSPLHYMEPFQTGTVYTANIIVTPKTGYKLEGIPANFFTVEGVTATVTHAAGSGTIAVVFPATEAGPDTTAPTQSSGGSGTGLVRSSDDGSNVSADAYSDDEPSTPSSSNDQNSGASGEGEGSGAGAGAGNGEPAANNNGLIIAAGLIVGAVAVVGAGVLVYKYKLIR